MVLASVIKASLIHWLADLPEMSLSMRERYWEVMHMASA